MPIASIIIPAFNDELRLQKLMKSLKYQAFKDFEIIVVDDGSTDNTSKIAKEFTDKVIIHEKNKGPAAARNTGIKHALGKFLTFIDTDCIADPYWLQEMIHSLDNADFVVGNVSIHESTYLGNCISALGFPAGANAGFERVWKVDKDSFTDHISSCNLGAKKEAFEKFGTFNESFPYAGGEDSELSFRVVRDNGKIKYNKKAKVWHEPRKTFIKWVKWQIYRGESNYHFHKAVKSVDSFIKLRGWYAINIIKDNIFTKRALLTIPLLGLSFIFQQVGYIKARLKR